MAKPTIEEKKPAVKPSPEVPVSGKKGRKGEIYILLSATELHDKIGADVKVPVSRKALKEIILAAHADKLLEGI